VCLKTSLQTITCQNHTEVERPKKTHKKSHNANEGETRKINNRGPKLYVIDGSTEKTSEVELTTNWRAEAISVS
jgi:hypothetical protein